MIQRELAGKNEWRDVGRFVLSNDLQMLTEPRPFDLTTRVVLGMRYGSRYDHANHSGLAHLLEHMLFKGTTNRSNHQIVGEIESIGGKLNAYTSPETMVIFAQIPSDHLKTAVDVISDIAFNSTFPVKELGTEKRVVLEEIAEVNSKEEFLTRRLFLNALYEKHPIKETEIGNVNSLRNVSRKDIVRSYTKYFIPNNMVLGLFGSFNEKGLINHLESLFGSRAKGSVAMHKTTSESSKPFKFTSIENRIGINQAHLILGVKTVAISHKDSCALDILRTILGNGASSRLFRELREKRGLTYTAFCSHSQGRDWGHFYVYTTVREKNIDSASKTIFRQFNSLKESLVKQEELDKAKNMIKGNIALLRDSPAGGAALVDSELTLGDVNKTREYIERINSVSSKDVLEVANDYFKKDKFAIALLKNKMSCD